MPDYATKAHVLPWIPPLELARCFGGEPLALLYSGVKEAYSGNISLLARGLEEEICGADLALARARIRRDMAMFDHAWFGYFGYELAHSLEDVPRCPESYVDLPPLWLGRFREIYRFDHAARALTCFANAAPRLPSPAPPGALSGVRELGSNMTRDEYLAGVSSLLEGIHVGEFYQANLTRKFYGRFDAEPDSLALFTRLCEVSPAPYSAYLRLKGAAILSSSPERFLTLEASGRATARPIKGSAPRFPDAREDAQSARQLALSAKDRAENLMIVDLMRNDFARACAPGSVKAERLFEVTSHANVHHLSSTVSGQLREGAGVLDLLAACFPPGSMTGAPKVSAMRHCAALEGVQRGVYSGALGWLGGDGSMDLSVVIRTLIMRGDRFEFQVGGGIVADSTPEGEWRETLVKARGLALALGVGEGALADL